MEAPKEEQMEAQTKPPEKENAAAVEEAVTEEMLTKQDGAEETAAEQTAAGPGEAADTWLTKEPEDAAAMEEETLGNPRSSYGLGSAAYLKGKNILVSLFVTTPESTWTGEEQQEILSKVGNAVSYIEAQASAYGAETQLLYDFNRYEDLKLEAETDFCINEETDFADRLDEEIARWMKEQISYEELLAAYDADGIATMIFVNNPGISYAIVYDGTDSKRETMVLFAKDYYQKGKKETATAYAHEILHVFGAHDLYEEAEFTAEVSDYVALTYPNEIMYTVAEQNSEITAVLSPITAYHLGWIENAEEIELFAQLERE